MDRGKGCGGNEAECGGCVEGGGAGAAFARRVGKEQCARARRTRTSTPASAHTCSRRPRMHSAAGLSRPKTPPRPARRRRRRRRLSSCSLRLPGDRGCDRWEPAGLLSAKWKAMWCADARRRAGVAPARRRGRILRRPRKKGTTAAHSSGRSTAVAGSTRPCHTHVAQLLRPGYSRVLGPYQLHSGSGTITFHSQGIKLKRKVHPHGSKPRCKNRF